MSVRKGQAALFMTMTLTVSLGLIGLVVDIGWAYWRREACGTAATAAAFAAVSAASTVATQSCGADAAHWNCGALSCPPNPTLPATSNLSNGCLYAKQNGFLNTGRQSVSMQGGTGTPPTPGISPAYWVSATVSERIPTLFSAVLGQAWTQISAQSTAAIFAGSSGGCVYVLNQTADQAWNQTGGAFTTGCGIYVDSSKSDAMNLTGGSITVNSGNNISIVGNKTSSGGTITFNGGGSLLAGQAVHGDPISGLIAPTPAGACIPDPGYSGAGGQNNITIPSGTYCGLSISGGVGLVLSGTYIIKTGDFKVTGGTITSAAGGAVIYYPPSNSLGTFTYTGGTMTLNAPTSGSLQGFAIWKDGVTANSAGITGGNPTINGIIYMPATALTYTGGTTPAQQTIIVDTIKMTGGSISQSASSPFFAGGAGLSGNFIVQ